MPPEQSFKPDGVKYQHTFNFLKIFTGIRMTSQDILSHERRAFFEETMQTTRVSTSLQPSERVYKGEWHWQGDEPTCCAWAVKNGGLAVGVELGKQCLQELLDWANDKRGSGTKGMNGDQGREILTQYPGEGLTMRLIVGAGFVSTAEEAESSTSLDTFFKKDFADIRNFLYTDKKLTVTWKPKDELIPRFEYNPHITAAQRIEHNAQLLKEKVSSNTALIVAVRTNEYDQLSNNGGSHAICIAGYRVDKNGTVDVQVVDSASGKIWMSLEHLSASVVPHYTFIIEKVHS